MQKIKCPHCNQIVGETDGKVIYFRLPRKNDGITIPFITGQFVHTSCGDSFYLPLPFLTTRAIIIIHTTKVAQATGTDRQ